jgi:hypothetical protein
MSEINADSPSMIIKLVAATSHATAIPAKRWQMQRSIPQSDQYVCGEALYHDRSYSPTGHRVCLRWLASADDPRRGRVLDDAHRLTASCWRAPVPSRWPRQPFAPASTGGFARLRPSRHRCKVRASPPCPVSCCGRPSHWHIDLVIAAASIDPAFCDRFIPAEYCSHQPCGPRTSPAASKISPSARKVESSRPCFRGRPVPHC